MVRHKARTEEDLEGLLSIQEKLLLNSIKLFDKGHTEEYLRIATIIRVLVHNTNSSHALLHQANRGGRRYLSSSLPMDEANLLSQCNLCALVIKNSGKLYFRAIEDKLPMKFLPLHDWWNEEVIFDRVNNRKFSRKQIILNAANKDGGAHVDPKVDTAFQFVADGMMKYSGKEDTPPDHDRHIIRQIAHELIKTLRPAYKRRWEIKYGAIVVNPCIREASNPSNSDTMAPQVTGYHLTQDVGDCPCNSGHAFLDCHKHGVNVPDDLNELALEFEAPIGAVSATFEIHTVPK